MPVMRIVVSAVLAFQRFASAPHFLVRQTAAAAIGITGMFVAMHVDYRRLLKKPVVYLALLTSTLLLIGVLIADRTHQVHRWIKLGPIQIQPSEIAKIALVLYLAYQI